MNLLPIITVRYNADGVMKKEKEKKQKKIDKYKQYQNKQELTREKHN